MTEHDANREWTQQELREYLRGIGMLPASVGEDEIIPQGVKFLAKPEKPTAADIERAKELIAEHPEWKK